MVPAQIETSRLRLIPHTPENLRALIEGPEFYERTSGLKPAGGLRDFIVSPDVSAEWLGQLKTAVEPDPWRYGFALIHVDSGTVIGNGSFTGPPDASGAVEIAYGVVPEYEGHGYATETAQALVAYARADGRVRIVCAHTLPECNASTRVLEKCGFARLGEINHPTDGLIWRWEKQLLPA